MPVIAVVNRKGGSGKSTLAAHIAAWCARNGSSVMLGDVDRQQSARAWLKRRDAALPAIAPWAVDQKNMLRVPTGITHVVLDTPGGMHGFELARVVMFADAIVMPVCNSMFDRESAEACHAELMTMPRVASGRCRLAIVGMRIDARTNSAQTLDAWAETLRVPFLGPLRETQLYVRSLERGLTIFDLQPHLAAADLAQWAPILQWLKPQLYPPQAANDGTSVIRPPAQSLAPKKAVSRPTVPEEVVSRRLGTLPGSLMPAQESMVQGGRMSTLSAGRTPAAPLRPAAAPTLARPTRLSDGPQIPQFLKRK
ncbi:MULTISPECIES: ParA family protein [Comamonadaceae]|uniref:ParA family protein n=1 Tax=Comamonadaceae TaxID=80864 RepID=UPI0027308224|nr:MULTISPECIES: ParA family protein [Comamonadaceae]MDP1741697.1 ParA family protein [Polaromonas sp.]MDP1942997.1 ParA family protein [Rhodoferax sp.]MDP3751939.1 ParA family protein [Polaromonas sp.]